MSMYVSALEAYEMLDVTIPSLLPPINMLPYCYTEQLNDVKSCFELSMIFFFSSRRRHTRFDCDWSSDVCSSDLRVSSDAKQLAHAACSAAKSRDVEVAGDRAVWRRSSHGNRSVAVPPGHGRLRDRKSVV